ncbi:arylalkylamine N-acetyltransferase 1-like [Panulirus ornatus]|uniref:arylalkylamine N-acetyltransferase 1-like n=1 Tax=Panulirus ornatus TaxID=150431 RepID=UPI003A896AAC
MNPANIQPAFMGFYNSVATCFRKYTAPLGARRKEAGGGESGEGSASGEEEPLAQTTASLEEAKQQELEQQQQQQQQQQQEQQQVQEPEEPELPSEPELPPDVLHKHDENIVFKVLTQEYSDAAVDLLCNHFFKDEPLGKALYLDSPREVDHWLSKVLPHMISHGVSVMAIDESSNGRLVGVAINSIKKRGDAPGPDDFLAWIDPQRDPKMFKIISFLTQLASDIDFFGQYKVDKFFNFELLNVDKEYGGRGIASMLVLQSCNVARTQGFSCLVAETTGIFSAKIFGKHAFKTIREVQYSQYRQNGRIAFPNTGIHTSARVSVKILEPLDSNNSDQQQSQAPRPHPGSR